MAASENDKKDSSMDKKIDQFCQSSAELLNSIHARCDTAETGKSRKKKRGRKKETSYVPEPDI